MKKLLFVLTVCLLLLFGCTAPQNDQSDALQNNDNQANTTPQVQEQTPAPAKTDALPPVDKAKAELKQLLDSSFNIEFQVTYDYSMTSPDQSLKGTMKQYIDGLDKIRFDMTTKDIETQTYIVDGTFTTCSKYSGAWNCFTSGDSDEKSTTTVQTNKDVSEEVVNSKVEAMPDRTIAGAKAKCYKVTNDDSTVDYCYSTDGVPLYIKTVANYDGKTATTEMTATTYSKSVSADIFVPPKSESTTDYSDLMKQYQTG
ncbi:MAG TPA: hypothetical protein VK158_03690 [Acidobacteriota bacterium]|nr:hypothetical protein [Acidobacteriota bacterium]